MASKSFKEWAKFLLKWYLGFAVIHMWVKIYSFWKTIQRAKRLLKNVPNYTGVLGEGIVENLDRLNDWRYDELSKHYDSPLVWTSGPGVKVVCNTPESVRHILKDDFNKCTKVAVKQDYGTYLFHYVFGQHGIFSIRHGKGLGADLQSEHNLWYKQRKIASLIFTKNAFKSFMHEVFVDKMNHMISFLEKESKQDKYVDMQGIFFSFTMNSIQKIFFGADVNSIGQGTDIIGDAFDNAHRDFMRFNLGNSLLIVLTRNILPFPFGSIFDEPTSMFFVNLLLRLSKEGKSLRKNVKILRTETLKIINQARSDPNLEKRRDILALFLNNKDKDVQFSNEDLCDIILHFILAGRDTTACTLTWLFYELSQNPQVQEKLAHEIAEKIPSGTVPSFSCLSNENMPYLNGVIYEALRLHPPVPEDWKMASDDVTFPSGETVPKGSQLIFHPYSMGRNPNLYPDPLKFNPERWIPFEKPSSYAFPVFQAGYRECLGRDMALFESKLVTAMLMQKFQFAIRPEDVNDISYTLMLTMSLETRDPNTGNKSFNLWMKPKMR